MMDVPGGAHTVTCTCLTLRDGSHLFLRIKWFRTSFFITALDFPCSWSNNVTSQEIERRASMWGVSGEDFLSQTRKYLSEYGVFETEYSFEQAMVQQPNRMRLSWITTDLRFNEEPRMALFLLKDNNSMDLVPEFLDALMGSSTLIALDEARRKIDQYRKAHQLAIRFSAASEKVRRSLAPNHFQGFTPRLYEQGSSTWAQPSKPSSMFHDVAVHQTLQGSLTCDENGVMAFEPRKLGSDFLDGTGWFNPRKSRLTDVESRSIFGIASPGREGIVMLSDSDEETCCNHDERSGGERQWVTKDAQGWQSRSSKRKERESDAHDVRTDPRNRFKRLDSQVCVSAATAARIKVENEKHASTFKYGWRAQWKPVYHDADNRSEKFRSTFNHESRAQWNSWISEAKTEVLSWEARTQNKDSATGGSCHKFDQPTENVVNTSSPSDFKGLHTPPTLKKLDKKLDVADFPQSDSKHLQSPADTRLVGNGGESDSVEEHVYEGGEYTDVDGMTGISESACNKLQSKQRVNSASTEKEAVRRKLPGRRGRPPGTKSQLLPKPLKSVSQARSKHSNPSGHPPAADYVVKKNLVDVDQDLQKAVPDSDFYCFDDSRGKDEIQPNQVWALYDDIDSMPRSLIRVKEVSMEGQSFWVKATWLRPHNRLNQKSERLKKTGFPISCGEFEEPKEKTTIAVLNCFSHKMEFTAKSDTVVQVYPQKGEIWALYHKDKTGVVLKQAPSEKDRKGKGNDNDKQQFRLVVILSNCGDSARETEILVLRKRTGYRTLWEPGYKKGSLPVEYMERFSHRVPAYKLTENDYPDLNNLDIWDIDAAAVPACQSKVT